MLRILFFMLFCFGLIACEGEVGGESADKTMPKKLQVAVSNYPLAYFTERIGGEDVEVLFPAALLSDPAYWQADGEAIAKMQAADLIILNGATYEKWLAVAALPADKVVFTAEVFADFWIERQGSVTHSHGEEGEHSHGETAFTTWLDLNLARRQAEAVWRALAEKAADKKNDFHRNYSALQADLQTLDERLLAMQDDFSDIHVIYSHPVYQYFSRRYQAMGTSLHWEADEMPAVSEWQKLERLLTRHERVLMLWEAEPNAAISQKLLALNVPYAVFAPLGGQPENGDFISHMQANIQRLADVLASVE
jgi:zinc transport system substrate-binding protein